MQRNKHIQTFPMELYYHLIRRFNGVTQTGIMRIKSTTLQIEFKKFENCSSQVPVRLFTKFAKAIKTIRDRYLTYDEYKVHVRIKLHDEEDRYIIDISGINKIPPGKIFNLFGLILWSHIKYISGVKPSESIYGRELTDIWKKEEKYTRKELNSSQKKSILTTIEMPCYICSRQGYIIQNWEFYYIKERRYINVKSRACEKHRTQVI